MEIEPTSNHKPLQIREASIPLPSKADGYATVMLVGTTGAGKTTVLRQFIGSDHERDRFPSTSTARTTTADIEIVVADGPFAGVVTFMDRREVKDEIEKCLYHACRTAVDERRGIDRRIANAFLSSQEQRFRLSYPLGRWEVAEESGQRSLNDDEATTEEEKKQNQARLEGYVNRIRSITKRVTESTNNAGSTLSEARGAGERDAWMNLFEEALPDDEGLQELVSDILAEIRNRFDSIAEGEFAFDANDWPIAWEYESENRDDFLKEVRWFSSNHSGQFGKLLTPLVNGVRVRGPFAPADSRLGTNRKFVILDGEGLGHRAQATTSIRSQITDRFAHVDVILLVDSAEQPMLPPPQELLKTAGSMGYADKIAFAFTHFENVQGDDLDTLDDREDRVRNPGRDAVSNMREVIGDDVAEDLLERVESSAFFLENMDKPTAQLPSSSISELRRLLESIEAAAHPEDTSIAKLRLSSRNLDMAIRDAVERFHEPWEGRLGIKRHPDYPKEHWTRIKALSLRMIIGQNAYDTLRPVDDLRSRLQEGVSRWLNRQASELDADVTQEERQAALTAIRQGVYALLQKRSEQRIADRHRVAWEKAYYYSGTGSSYDRADEIDGIFKNAAPSIGFDMSLNANDLINGVYEAVQVAAEEVDGRLD